MKVEDFEKDIVGEPGGSDGHLLAELICKALAQELLVNGYENHYSLLLSSTGKSCLHCAASSVISSLTPAPLRLQVDIKRGA